MLLVELSKLLLLPKILGHYTVSLRSWRDFLVWFSFVVRKVRDAAMRIMNRGLNRKRSGGGGSAF